MASSSSSSESHRNPANSRYALAPCPKTSGLSVDEKMARVKHLIDAYGSECVEEAEIRKLLEACDAPVAYDGFEPSGRMHIAQGLMKKHFVNALTSAGFTYLFWVADWFAVLNLKMGGDLERIKIVGRYMIEVWRAVGMDMDRVRFLWASEEFSTHADVYWSRVLDISTKNTLARIQRCGQIMGRGDKGLHASQIFYPCMQAADVFFLGVDVCQLGLDQRKVNMLAREYADQVKLPKPAILSHPMCPGLQKGQQKMSKSAPDTAIFMEDTEADVQRKVNKAFCPGPADFQKDVAAQEADAVAKKIPFDRDGAENLANPVLSYFKLIVADSLKPGEPMKIGEVAYATFAELRAAYLDDKVHPADLKQSLIGYINSFLEPVRQHFNSTPELIALRAAVIEAQQLALNAK